MGRTQYSYDYPEVHPPHPQTQYRTDTQQTDGSVNSRYSWAEAPAEEQNTHVAQSRNRQSTAPPLPNVPVHLNQDFQTPQPVVQEQPTPQPQPQPQSQARHQPPQQLYHGQTLSKQQEAAMYQQSYQATQHSQQTYAQPQPRHQQPQPSQPEDQHVELPQKPDPIKQTPDHPNYRPTIMPDENPLTPTSPTTKHASIRPQTTNMSVISSPTSNYNFASYAPVPQPTTGGTWTHSLCSCSEPTVCMTGLFCPCILYGRTQHRLHQRSEKKDPTNMLGYSSVNGSCMAWAFLCGINGILSGIQKSRVRRAYDMDSGSGNVFSDCLAGCCCCCCVLAQNEKEVRQREEEGRRGNALEGYVPPGGMTFAPPPR